MLKVEHISSGYGKMQTLFDVTFEVDRKDILLIVGSNGSGKSTLLKTIFRQLPLWGSGGVFLNNEDISRIPSSSLLNKGLLYIPQKNNVFENLTLKENLEIAGLIIKDKNILKQRIESSLNTFDLLIPLLNHIPMKLSGGERQLLTLAMASLHQPQIILIDEPLTGLSDKNLMIVIDKLRQLNQINGITLIIVEHHVKECISIANKVIGMKLGKIFSKLKVDEKFNIDQMNSVFI